MSRVFLHSGNRENSLTKLMLYLFIPFVIYGFYKNGISLYTKGYVNLFMMFKPLIFLLSSLIVTILVSKINKEQVLGYRLISNLMIAMVASPSLNIIVFIILLIGLNLISKYFKFNIVPIFMVISIIISMVMKEYNFFNSLESAVVHNYSLFDYILGKGYGGISNTLLFMSAVSLVILILNINYKKQIPIMAFGSYYFLAFITSLVSGILDQNLLLNNNVIFAFIFISNLSIYTPYSFDYNGNENVLLGNCSEFDVSQISVIEMANQDEKKKKLEDLVLMHQLLQTLWIENI